MLAERETAALSHICLYVIYLLIWRNASILSHFNRLQHWFPAALFVLLVVEVLANQRASPFVPAPPELLANQLTSKLALLSKHHPSCWAHLIPFLEVSISYSSWSADSLLARYSLQIRMASLHIPASCSNPEEPGGGHPVSYLGPGTQQVLTHLVELDGQFWPLGSQQQGFRLLEVILLEAEPGLLHQDLAHALRVVAFSHPLGTSPVLVVDMPGTHPPTHTKVLRPCLVSV